MHKRPYILSIAGFDPSGGAGLLADIKTFESLKCYGLGVQTANTIQNDNSFKSCSWINIEEITSQIEILFDRFEIHFVKIGIVENWDVLQTVIDLLLQKNPEIKIVLDPVLSASSDFEFHSAEALKLEALLPKIFMLTPNLNELKAIWPQPEEEEIGKFLSSKTNLFLKGGHRSNEVGKDELFTKDGKHFIINPKAQNISEKHGSGCVLSSAITAYLALGFPLLKACFRAKRYSEKYLSSNPSLLGFHKI